MTRKKYLLGMPLIRDKDLLEECVNNRYKKKKNKKYIKPVVKKCQSCGERRVRYHHFLCNICHLKTHNPEKYKEQYETKKEIKETKEIKF